MRIKNQQNALIPLTYFHCDIFTTINHHNITIKKKSNVSGIKCIL